MARYNNEKVQDLFNMAADLNYTAIVRCDGEVDYRGTNMAAALDAVLAVDEAEVRFLSLDGRTGWALIIPGLADDEQVADCSGIVEEWI